MCIAIHQYILNFDLSNSSLFSKSVSSESYSDESVKLPSDKSSFVVSESAVVVVGMTSFKIASSIQVWGKFVHRFRYFFFNYSALL